MLPLISVVVPIYQVKKYLSKCIDSIIGQTYENIEIILVDDGSTDGSGELCDEYREKDSRVIVFHKENGGLSSARNVGIDHAHGEYIAFIDSDDWVDPRYLEVLYNIIVDEQCEIAQCAHWDVWSEGLAYSDQESKSIIFSPKELAYAYHSIGLWQIILAWNKLYKTDLFKNIRYPEGKIHEDEYISYKVCWKASRIAVTYMKLYYYRHRENSIKTQKYSYKRLDVHDAYKERAKFYEDRGEHKLAILTQRRHCKWIREAIAQIQKSDLEDQDTVINMLSSDAAAIEQVLDAENMEMERHSYHRFLFPFGLIGQGSRIVLYGAGDVGVQYFRQITNTNYCNILGWIDKNNEACSNKGIPAWPPAKLRELQGTYDYLVIALYDKELALAVIDELKEKYSVEADRIVYDILPC